MHQENELNDSNSKAKTLKLPKKVRILFHEQFISNKIETKADTNYLRKLQNI